MKLSQLKNRYFKCEKNSVFTTRAMWELIKELENNPGEIYWDYSSYLSNEEFVKIHENGFDGLYDIENELWDINIDNISDIEYVQLREAIPNDLASYRLSYLKKALKEYREEEPDVDARDLMNLTFGELRDMNCGFDEIVDTLQEYQSVSLNLNGIFSNSSYDKSLWYSPEDSELREMFKETIEKYEAEGYEWKEPEVQYRIRIAYPQDNFNEVAEFFENFNKPGAYVKAELEVNLEFEKEDDDDEEYIEVEVEKEVCINKNMITIEDSDEYADDDWNSITDTFINMEDKNFYNPSDEHIKKLQQTLENIPNTDEASCENVKVQCIVNKCFHVTELIEKKTYDKYPIYLTFGFDTDSGLWAEKAISVDNNFVIPKNLYIDIDGKITAA